MKTNNPLDSIYFISFPEDTKLSKDLFQLDTSIPLPVQKKDSEAPGQFNPKEITQEQILAGILTILAYDKHNQHTQYYRSLITKARPNIKKELSETAILKAKNEDFELAEEIFLALQGIDPEDKAITLNMAIFFDQRADNYRQSGLTEDADAYDHEAQSYYTDAMLAEPSIPDAYFNAGFFYIKKRDYIKARDSFETYVALTCDAKDEDLGPNGVYKKERAQEILNQIKHQNMDDSKFSSAYELILNGQEEKGLDQIRAFLQNNPHVWNAWFMLGWGLRKLERYDDGIEAFKKALELGGNEVSDTFNELAICYLESGNLLEAKQALLKALSIDPESTKIMSNLGYLSLKEGNTSEAQKYFSAVLEFDPNDKIAQIELAKLDN